jgi:hypothetical protein
VLATLCAELDIGSPLERRQALAEEALAIAESSGDDAIIVRVLNHVVNALQVPSLLGLSLTRTADAVVRAERVGDPVLLLRAALVRADAAARAGDIDEMRRRHETARLLAEQLDQPYFTWGGNLDRAFHAQIAGDTDQAEQFAREALRIGTDCGQPDAAVYFGSQFMIVNLQRGTAGDLVPLIEQAAADAPDLIGVYTAALALAHAEADRTQKVRRLMEEFAAAGFDLPMDEVWIVGMACYAGAAVAVRDATYAGPLFDQLAPWADQLAANSTTALGPVSYYLGGLATILRRYDEADGYFTQAAAFNDRVGAKFFAAQTDLSWGKMLAERDAPGDAEKARDLLSKSQTAAAAHGYGNVERRAGAALQHLD